MLSNYPPGVTGREPEITGDYPCGFCGGFGTDFHGSETSVTVFHRDGRFKTFDNTDAAEAYAGPDDEVVVDEHPTGEACCVPCKGTGREPEDVTVVDEGGDD
jgi:hypothetical protein